MCVFVYVSLNRQIHHAHLLKHPHVLKNKTSHLPARQRTRRVTTTKGLMQAFPRIRISMQLNNTKNHDQSQSCDISIRDETTADPLRLFPRSESCPNALIVCAGSIYKHVLDDGEVQLWVEFDDAAHPDRYLLDSSIESFNVIHATRAATESPLFAPVSM